MFLELLDDNSNIIQVCQASFVSVATQDGLYQPFKHFWNVAEAKGHNGEMSMALTGKEVCLLFITEVQGHMPVSPATT